MTSFSFSPIGTISSCFKEKFGIPRQPGLVPAATAKLVLDKQFSEDCVRSLEGFSHIWVSFVFHETLSQGWKPMVRPPRLGGNTKVGVFASRSTFRPNALGLSVVKLDNIESFNSQQVLHLSGCDLLDGTPVLDIKPYLPYVDSIRDAKGGFASEPPQHLFNVEFSEDAIKQSLHASERIGQDVRQLITQVLQLDPRPSYQKTAPQAAQSINHNPRIYSMKLYDFDLKWQYCENNNIMVLALVF
jgi:tRNA-Thr(GGU) m(6)t(6)A37 methyltransferase TsaA